MDDQSIVRTAKTVEEAIELATLELGVDRDEIEVDVVSRGRPASSESEPSRRRFAFGYSESPAAAPRE